MQPRIRPFFGRYILYICICIFFSFDALFSFSPWLGFTGPFPHHTCPMGPWRAHLLCPHPSMYSVYTLYTPYVQTTVRMYVPYHRYSVNNETETPDDKVSSPFHASRNPASASGPRSLSALNAAQVGGT